MAAARPFRRPAGISSLPSFNWTLNFRQQVYDRWAAEGRLKAWVLVFSRGE